MWSINNFISIYNKGFNSNVLKKKIYLYTNEFRCFSNTFRLSKQQKLKSFYKKENIQSFGFRLNRKTLEESFQTKKTT